MKPKMITTSALAALLMAGVATAAGAEEVTIASWGGSYQDAQSKALFQPASKATGIEVTEETYGGMSDVRLQVRTGAVTYDIVVSGTGSAARAAEEGLLQKLGFDIIDVSNFDKSSYTDYCIGGDVFSTVYAWNAKKYGEDAMDSWADFWNVEKFPGTRSYRGKVAGALEPALMADGVAPEDVYDVLSTEEGIDRAIDKIRELKPNIAVWWTSGAQHAQLMKDGEVDMATGWNGRFDVVNQDGGHVDYSYNQALLDYDCYAIPKGAPHAEAAMKFIAEIMKPKYQAEMTKYITYGPTNLKTYDLGLIDEEFAKTLPSYPANLKKQLPINLEWYAQWETIAAEKYQAMITE